MRIAPPQTSQDRTPFIGRRELREQLGAELRRGAGLVTLCGPSGIGKTRLARQVAGEHFDTFDAEGGVWFCSLAECKAPSDIEAAVARALEIHQQQGDPLARSLANRGPLLLILDNADPIATRSAEVLGGWLERCVELQLIMTSLIPAGVPGEVVLELHPLEPEDAVALYLDRAHRAWADRSFSASETSEVQELVRRLDRIPLAIELAAARVRVLPPRTMLSMIEKRFELLRTSTQRSSGANAPQRKSSLRSALELTWSHLETHEQLALARASVFEGGFSAEAASAVLGPGGEESETSGGNLSETQGDDDFERSPGTASPEILQLLDDLRRKSLLIYEDRYLLLESVQEYAVAELRRMGRWEETIACHAAFFLGQKHAKPRLSMEPRRAEEIRWLKHERANLVAIHQRFFETDPSVAARAGLALAPLIHNLGHSASDANLTVATLDAARRSQDPKLLLAALEATYTAHFRAGRFDEAKAAMAEQLELAKSSGEKVIEALTLSLLAIVHLDQGELERSRLPLQRAAQLSEEVGLPQIEAMALLAQGVEAIERGAHVEAEARLTRSVLLLQQHGQRGSEVKSLHSLGLTLANQGRHLEARRAMKGAIEACRDIRHRYFEAAFLANLADIDLAAGFLDEAEIACRQSLGIYRELGNRFREGEVMCSLGIISLERGNLDAAAEQLARADEILHECGSARMRMEVLCFLVVLESRRWQPEEARWILDEVQAYRGSDDENLNPLFAEGAAAILEVATVRRLPPPISQETANRRREDASEPLPREGMVRGHCSLAAGAPSTPTPEARIEGARLVLAAIKREPVGMLSFLRVLARLLERELAEWDAGAPAPAHAHSFPTLTFGATLDWMQLPGSQPISLRRRRALRGVFASLAKARLDAPGHPVRVSELIAAGWPGTDPTADGTMNRLHVAIWALRDMGLQRIVQSTPTGYLLDPAYPIRVES